MRTLLLASLASSLLACTAFALDEVKPAETSQSIKVLNAKPDAEDKLLNPYSGQKPAGSAKTKDESASGNAAKAAAAAAAEAPVPEGPAVKRTDGKTKSVESGEKSKPEKTAKKAKPKPEPANEKKPAAAPAQSDETDIAAPVKKPEPKDTPTLAKPALPDPTLHIAINLTKQELSVREDGGRSHTWEISTGRAKHPTPKGTFRPVWMAKDWYSRKYDDAPMPHAIFFHGGAAIHGTDSVHALGRPVSHGCVRLTRRNAARLYRLVTKHGKKKTEIKVFGTPPKPSLVARGDRDDEPRRRDRRRWRDDDLWDDDFDFDYGYRNRRRAFMDRAARYRRWRDEEAYYYD